MKIPRESLDSIDFDGLDILDYTAGLETASSVAEITVPPGIRHRTAWSRRSDKYYYVVSGRLEFLVEGESFDLASGDVCVVSKGQRFSYENRENEGAKILLIHTPGFDLDSEVFED